MGKVIVLKACLWPHDDKAMMCRTPRHLLRTKVIMRISQYSTDRHNALVLCFLLFKSFFCSFYTRTNGQWNCPQKYCLRKECLKAGGYDVHWAAENQVVVKSNGELGQNVGLSSSLELMWQGRDNSFQTGVGSGWRDEYVWCVSALSHRTFAVIVFACTWWVWI